jgi:hypothetical protein
MNSVVRICNEALSHFGGGEINDINEGSEPARICNVFYESSRDEVLKDFPWPFARKIQVLALTNENIPGWCYTYQLPTKCLKPRRVFNSANVLADDNSFDVYGDKLVTNLHEASLDFTSQVTDPVLFDVKFSEALAYKLASKIVIPLTGNTTRKQEFYSQYEQALGEAKTAVMRERFKELQYVSSWVDGR